MNHPGMTERLTLIVMLLALSASVGCDALIETIVERAAERQRNATHREWLSDDALHVFLCGTGAPLPDPTSAAACTVVVAGGKVWVVDVGPGSQEVAQLGGVPREDLGGVFLTHFHSDHIGELGEWAMQSWVSGRQGPLHVYGPAGVEQVVGGFRQAYLLDDEYRIAHHGLENLPRSASEWIPHQVPHTEGEGTQILDEGGLVVKAFAVDHKPAEPAVGYRFEYKGRTVVISGDTARSSNLELNAAGADLLIHEALVKDVIEALSDSMGRAGEPRLQRLVNDILDYHTSPSEAVASARAAGVDSVVFTHLVPPVPAPLRKWLFTRKLDAGGELEVILGRDGMHFRLPADSDAIEQEVLID
jgi:ribonuclease Z